MGGLISASITVAERYATSAYTRAPRRPDPQCQAVPQARPQSLSKPLFVGVQD
jgi:hypothetical protein